MSEFRFGNFDSRRRGQLRNRFRVVQAVVIQRQGVGTSGTNLAFPGQTLAGGKSSASDTEACTTVKRRINLSKMKQGNFRLGNFCCLKLEERGMRRRFVSLSAVFQHRISPKMNHPY